jgi:hypothetical protein
MSDIEVKRFRMLRKKAVKWDGMVADGHVANIEYGIQNTQIQQF